LKKFRGSLSGVPIWLTKEKRKERKGTGGGKKTRTEKNTVITKPSDKGRYVF